MQFREFIMPEHADGELDPQVNDILYLHGRDILKASTISTVTYARSLENLEYSRVFAATVDDEVLGMTCYESVPSEQKAWIGAVAVSPHVRGNNIGRFMFKNLVQTAFGDKHKSLGLMSFTESVPFYSRLGFVPVEGTLRMYLDLTNRQALKRAGLLD